MMTLYVNTWQKSKVSLPSSQQHKINRMCVCALVRAVLYMYINVYGDAQLI